ncbi:Hypothetical predicted protein [Pelobates cultripes]|uniref:Uncharacterized protein n=1 Tax=Pelobates cultripes TaxID=61616 RepID=A0AAD1WRK3_PELCU|nr:Hypothetical predicted protein [Pelobates cultripes]
MRMAEPNKQFPATQTHTMANSTCDCNGGRAETDVLKKLDAIFAFWAQLALRERQVNIQATLPRNGPASAGHSHAVPRSEATTRWRGRRRPHPHTRKRLTKTALITRRDKQVPPHPHTHRIPPGNLQEANTHQGTRTCQHQGEFQNPGLPTIKLQVPTVTSEQARHRT